MQSPFTDVACDEKREVVITADSAGLVKTWQGHTGQELASFSTSSPHCTLLQRNINDSWYLFVSSPLMCVAFQIESGKGTFMKVFIMKSRWEPARVLCAHLPI